MDNRIKNSHGFSLMELTMAVGIGSIVLLSFGAAYKMIGTVQQSTSQMTQEWTTMAVVGTNFSKLAADAKSSSMFLHLPIDVQCTSYAKPCLRRSLSSAFEAAPAGAVQPSSIEFYADVEGVLKNDFKVSKRGTGNDTTYTSGDTISLPAASSSADQLMLSWPLLDSSSEPLPMLVQPNPAQYEIPGFSAASAATPGTWVFLKFVAGVPWNGGGLKGQLLSFYNPGNPHLYVIKSIEAAKSCLGSDLSTCQSVVGAENAASVQPSDLIVKLTELDTSVVATYLPSSAVLGGSGAWPSGTSDLSFFPDISTTVAESGMDYFSGSYFDPRKLLHYFHASGINGGLMAAPVSLVSYRIANTSLVRDVYSRGQPAGTRRDEVISGLEGAVLISRALGTQTLTLSTFVAPRGPSTADRSSAQGSSADGSPFTHLKLTMSGTMRESTSPSANLNRKTALYPKDCEMTFSLQRFCGDGDVDAYYAAHPNEAHASGASDLRLVLGYWLARDGAGDDHQPTADAWYALGYDTLDFSQAHVGLRQINSNERLSASKMLKDEAERIVYLGRFLANADSSGAPIKYNLYSTAMLCTNYEDASGTLPDDVFDTFSSSAQACSGTTTTGGTTVTSIYSGTTAGVTCPAPAISCTGGTYSYSYSYDDIGTPSCSTAVVCPTVVATSTGSGGGTVTTGGASGGGGGGGGGGATCFAAGTPITMADGSRKNIEDVQVGDATLAYDEDSGTEYIDHVVEAIHHKTKWENLFHLVLDDGRTLIVNDAHPLYIVELGSYAVSKYVAAHILAGARLSMLDEDGKAVRIVSMDPERKLTHLYNLHVNGIADRSAEHIWGRGHNYFANGILVHNLKQNTVNGE